RHTRFSRDWSSDVCSSDLNGRCGNLVAEERNHHRAGLVLQLGYQENQIGGEAVEGSTHPARSRDRLIAPALKDDLVAGSKLENTTQDMDGSSGNQTVRRARAVDLKVVE